MDIKQWLVSEARKLTTDIKDLNTDIAVIEGKFQVQVVDKDNTLPLGEHEWASFKDNIKASCTVMTDQLEDFIDNRYQRQLHWSALRLLAAAGVLSAEINSFQSKLKYIASNPSDKSVGVTGLHDYFKARIEPTGARFSLRITQLLTRVLDPSAWSVEADLTQGGSGNGNVRLRLQFSPATKTRRREELEREKRLKRIEIDD